MISHISKIILSLMVVFLIGCSVEDKQKDNIQNMFWSHYNNPKLTFTWNQYYNPFSLHEIEAIIVPIDASKFSASNAIPIKPCSASSKSVDLCINPLYLKDKALTGKNTQILIFSGIKWNLF